MCFDITNRSSFDDLNNWLDEIDKYSSNANKLLVACKTDLAAQRTVTLDEAQEFASIRNLELLETSAKEAINVGQTFQTLAIEVMSRVAPDTIPKVLVTLTGMSVGGGHVVSCLNLSGSELARIDLENDMVVEALAKKLSEVLQLPRYKLQLIWVSGAPISKAELAMPILSLLGLDVQSRVKHIFQKWNPTGQMSEADLLSICHNIGTPCSDAQLREALRTAGVGADGDIHYDAFLAWVFATHAAQS